MTPTIAARTFLVMACPWAYLYAAKPCAPACEPLATPQAKPCSCHSDESLYGRLLRCPQCRHRSFDPGAGCERRKCAYDGEHIEQGVLV